jgi:hypothetical protein
MSSKAPTPKPAVKRVVSKPTPAKKAPAKKAPVKKAKPVKPHHKFFTRKGNWKKSPEWLKHCEEEKKKEQPKKK